jgi:SAM-dependent methyltransferase
MIHVNDIVCTEFDPFRKMHLGRHVAETIHYAALASGDFSAYEKYVRATDQAEHSADIFRTLVRDFDLDKLGKITVVYIPSMEKYTVMDGVHRLAILAQRYKWKTFPRTLFTFKLHDPERATELLAATVGYSFQSNGWCNRGGGYHSVHDFGLAVDGQRDPAARLDIIRKHINLTGLSVLDLGCNTGGMLLNAPEIKTGHGVDFDDKCLDAARFIARGIGAPLTFERGDLNEYIVPQKEYDVIYCLSLGSWVRDWRKLYTMAMNGAKKALVLETNNSQEGRAQLDLLKNVLGAKLQLISSASTDDRTGNIGRCLYIARFPTE